MNTPTTSSTTHDAQSPSLWPGEYDRLFIGGRWVLPATSERLDVISPFTEQVIASVPSASRKDVDQAVTAARTAFDRGPWPRMSLAERVTVLQRLETALDEHGDELAALVTTEMGCPISQTRASQAGAAVALLRTFLELAPRYPWQVRRSSTTGEALVTREPIGVVAAVVPWNAPLSVAMLKLGPALLAGCTVVLKPSPEAPLDAYLVAELMQSAGIPEGVVNIVPADRDISEYLVTHPCVDKVSFTGSTAVGRHIAALCGQDLRRITLELGGKSAALVLGDADLDLVVNHVRSASLRYNGQACNNKTRIVVARSRKDELLERLTAMVTELRVGDPADEATHIGPLVSERQLARVERYLDAGRAEGAKVVAGGRRPAGLSRGWFIEPTIFTDVTANMTIAQDEIFGPVLSVLSFTGEDEAVAIANNSAYGLSGSVFTSDPHHALTIARRIRTGSVELNGCSAGFAAPLGGFKHSGIGREAGLEGFDAFVELKSFGLTPELIADLTELPGRN